MRNFTWLLKAAMENLHVHDFPTTIRRINALTISPASILLAVISLALAPSARCNTTILSSPHDARQYAAFELPNRLKVLVIEDPKTDKSAAALDIFVGSNANPASRPGLAHFLEHMLFLGTRKYPEPDAFQAFITKHAGEQNAYTSFAHTNYFFDVDNNHLREALDRFGQFFIAPTFAKAYVDRERSAVDAEFHAKKKNDAWRKMETIKQVMNPRHPFSRFTIGNLATLSDKADTEGNRIQEDLIAFYRRYYSANLMALVVIGKEPIDVLTRWIREIFSAIPNFQAKPSRITEPMFTPEQLPTRVTLKPVQEQRRLELLFPVPALKPHYKTKPLRYISHIIGHEGKGSLLSLLKEQGWAEALSAGARHDHTDSATFGVSITLTKKGIGKIDEITALVFQAIRLMEERGVHEWLFQELSQLANIDFLFQQKSPSTDYASHLANALHQYPTLDILRGPFAMDHYDEALLRQYLGTLTPNNVLILVLDPDTEKTTAETTADIPWSEVPWFGAQYRQEQIDPDLSQTWRKSPIDTRIVIPSPNIFIPRDLSLKSVTNPGRPFVISHSGYGPKDRPTRIIHTPGLSVWFRQDTTYGMPRADFYFSIRSPIANDTPTHSVMTALFVALVRDQLTEFSYPASLAGLDYDLYPHIRGLSVRISGYHDKQKLLLTRIVETLSRPKFQPERFRIAKQELTRKLRNIRKQMPYRQAVLELRTILLQPHFPPSARIEALESVTLSDLRTFVPEFLQRISLVALSHGNLQEADALDMIVPLKEHLIRNAIPTKVSRGQVIELAKGNSHIRTIALDHNDAVAMVYFQGQQRGFRELAEMALLGQILKAPFFHRLRTEQELGYVVLAKAFPIIEAPGLLFLVQSPNTHPADLTNHIRQFLTAGSDTLAGMSETEFIHHKTALITRTLALEENLKVRSNRYWQEIEMQLDTFDSREQTADAARTITLAEIRHIYRTRIQGNNKRQLIIHAVGNGHRQPSSENNRIPEDMIPVIIQDPTLFKQKQNVFSEKNN
uniref:Protease 3 n=1 Tax=Candidatus Kentrum sp. TUN TaxID=2126343 RepID=A0A450ZPT9_9GAMM|nr:MAG: Secreted Zn-dependent peptidases, insulinase-like [Candidatus Kentron sp. TUN]VFK55849.1 MAG: Secreted Zn-dependent peptidases, insulinase-like [Candidatus Kentron sp. TUN]VFK58286.1 MAG: Secreted Zn-dependent peptidases, insulinase-like [Candidatus Kentron sp. TUN]